MTILNIDKASAPEFIDEQKKDKPPIITSCRDCIFSEKQKDEQHGCKFGRIERFQVHGEVHKIQRKWLPLSYLNDNNLLKEWDRNQFSLKEYNDAWFLCEFTDNKLTDLICHGEESDINETTNEAYFIIDRLCNRYKTKEWAADKNWQNLENIAIQESKLNLTLLIVLGENDTRDQLAECVESIKSQTLPFSEIITLNMGSLKSTEITSILQTTGLVYRNVTPANKSLPLEMLLDEAYRFINSQFFAECISPIKLPITFVENLDIMYNDRLERFLLVSFHNHNNIKIYQKYITKLLKGNQTFEYNDGEAITGLSGKIQKFCQLNNQEHLAKVI